MYLNTKAKEGWVKQKNAQGEWERVLSCYKNPSATDSWNVELMDGYVATNSFSIPQ
ncbi:hypothetical protein D3C87_1780130 [compost metagenome]